MPKKKDLRGFAKVCRKSWTFAKWERCVKDVKKSKSGANPYAVCNNTCKKESINRKKHKKRKKKS